MSDRRRHGTPGSGKKILIWCGWGALVLLLGGNIFMAFFNAKADDTPQGFLTPEHLQAVAFWAPVAVAAVMSVMGLYWSSKALSHNERSSMVWLRRGYLFSLVASLVLVMAVFEPETFPRPWIAAIGALLLGGQTCFAAMSAQREFKRAEGGEGGRRGRSRSSSSEAPAAVPAPTPTPE